MVPRQVTASKKNCEAFKRISCYTRKQRKKKEEMRERTRVSVSTQGKKTSEEYRPADMSPEQ